MIDREVPKRPRHEPHDIFNLNFCPNEKCRYVFTARERYYKYCPYCGQAVDLSEVKWNATD